MPKSKQATDEKPAKAKVKKTAGKEAAAKPEKAEKVAKPKVKRAKRASKKKVDTSRLRLVWGVFDNSNQQIATFPYPDRRAAEEKVAQMGDKGRGPYFVQPVKEPMPIEIEEKPPIASK